MRKACIEIRFQALRLIVDGMVRERERLLKNVPQLGDKIEVQQLLQRLEKIIDDGIREILEKEAKQPHGMPSFLVDEIKNAQREIKDQLERDLTMLQGNAQLSRIAEPPGTISITAGPNSIISVGNTAHSIVSTLNQSRGTSPELSEILRQLAEAIETSSEMAKEQQTEALESLEFIVSQIAARPDERAKPSVIRTAWNSLAQSVAFAANLAQLVGVAAPLLAQHMSIQ